MKEKLIINTNLIREFENLKSYPLRDNKLIAENVDMMYCDNDDKYHCLLVYDAEQGDGLLIESEGTAYARYSQYIPMAKELVEMNRNPEILFTDGEKKLHKLLNEISDRIAEFSHSGYSKFLLDDVLEDLGCDFDELKKMLVKSAAEILNERSDIKSVKINDLDIPFQPGISVELEEPEMDITM